MENRDKFDRIIDLAGCQRLLMKLDCKFSRMYDQDHQFSKMFISNAKGIAIGYMRFKSGILFSIKMYRDKLIGPKIDICRNDKLAWRLRRNMRFGEWLTNDKINELIARANDLADEDLHRKMSWRAKHPPNVGKDGFPRKRKPLVRKNPRDIVSLMVMDKNFNVEIKRPRGQK